MIMLSRNLPIVFIVGAAGFIGSHLIEKLLQKNLQIVGIDDLSSGSLSNLATVLYYPYGGSSVEHREVMANNLVAWEAIKLGQKLKLKSFDMWGALGPSPNPNDPFIGFHRFKSGYGGELVEYLGSFDLIINKPLFYLFNLINQSTSLKVALLKLLKR